MSVTTIDTPRARKNDPATSHEAAESVRNVRKTHEFVIRALRRPAHDGELVKRYQAFAKAPRASESGIRTRRSELVAFGMIIDSGKRVRLESGRQAIVWKINADDVEVKRILGRA